MSHRDGAAGTRVNGRRDTTPFLSPSDSQLETRRQREQREARGRCLMTEDAVSGARVLGKGNQSITRRGTERGEKLPPKAWISLFLTREQESSRLEAREEASGKRERLLSQSNLHSHSSYRASAVNLESPVKLKALSRRRENTRTQTVRQTERQGGRERGCLLRRKETQDRGRVREAAESRDLASASTEKQGSEMRISWRISFASLFHLSF